MPPCNAFWSLTAYGTDLYLVENEIDRWSISDRTPRLVYDDDGSLTILISATRPAKTINSCPSRTAPSCWACEFMKGIKKLSLASGFHRS